MEKYAISDQIGINRDIDEKYKTVFDVFRDVVFPHFAYILDVHEFVSSPQLCHGQDANKIYFYMEYSWFEFSFPSFRLYQG